MFPLPYHRNRTAIRGKRSEFLGLLLCRILVTCFYDYNEGAKALNFPHHHGTPPNLHSGSACEVACLSLLQTNRLETRNAANILRRESWDRFQLILGLLQDGQPDGSRRISRLVSDAILL